ncbi:MAG: hypothetical protein ICV53_01595 [Flavisolibacter sp.]|nr:hypothetical protein [Flavisolibacter sp.]
MLHDLLPQLLYPYKEFYYSSAVPVLPGFKNQAVQHDPEMKGYYERRAALGKHHMAILHEVKFKLILRMFAVVHKGEAYVKNLKSAA